MSSIYPGLDVHIAVIALGDVEYAVGVTDRVAYGRHFNLGVPHEYVLLVGAFCQEHRALQGIPYDEH